MFKLFSFSADTEFSAPGKNIQLKSAYIFHKSLFTSSCWGVSWAASVVNVLSKPCIVLITELYCRQRRAASACSFSCMSEDAADTDRFLNESRYIQGKSSS